MKIKKLIFPMLAIIFAISMAFPNADIKTEPVLVSQDYILNNGKWKAIPEQSCTGTQFNCRVQLGEGGPIFDVYDEMNLQTLKKSPSPQPTVINP